MATGKTRALRTINFLQAWMGVELDVMSGVQNDARQPYEIIEKLVEFSF
jgi:hypothetical protein